MAMCFSGDGWTEDGRLWLGWMVVVVFTVQLDDREGQCRY